MGGGVGMLHNLSIWKLYLGYGEIYEHKRKCMQHGIREWPMTTKVSSIQHRKERWLWFLTCKTSNKDLVIWMLLRPLYENTDKMKDTLIYSSHLENPKISYSISEVLSVSHRPLSRSVINFGSLSAKGHVIDYHPDNRPGKRSSVTDIWVYNAPW